MSPKENKLNPNKWVERYADFLFNYAFVRLNNKEITKDLVSETFLAGLKAKKSFKGQASERTWLTAILKRKNIDYYRKASTKKQKAGVNFKDFSIGENNNYIEDRLAREPGLNAEEHLVNLELREAIFNCLNKLPDKHAQVFIMKSIEHKSTDEICNEMGLSSSNLWVMIHRARQKMAECLEKQWL